MSAPVAPQFDPQATWEGLVAHGLSREEAAQHVLRQVMNQPANVRQQYLKDVDPGVFASFGLGAADMMSFGLGKQIAASLDRAAPESDRSYTALAEEAAQANHPTAHFAGELGGLLIPIAGELGLAKAGVKVAPTALGAAVRRIENRFGRATAKTVLNAATGAGYAGAQAAGRTEGPLADRAKAAARVVPYGAIVGAALPLGIAGAKATVGPTANRFLDALAGKSPVPAGPQATGLLAPEAPSAADALRAQLLKAGVLPENVEAQMARQAAGPQGLLVPEPLQTPAYVRREAPLPEPRPSRMAKGQPGAALPPSWQTSTPDAGGVGGHSYSGTWPKEIPVANVAKAQAAVRGLSIADLQRVWQTPNIPGALRQMVEAEFQRRMVTLPSGLLAAPIR